MTKSESGSVLVASCGSFNNEQTSFTQTQKGYCLFSICMLFVSLVLVNFAGFTWPVEFESQTLLVD